MSPVGFAWRSLTRRPARAVLGIAGVAVVGALLLDMLLLARGLEVSFAELLDRVGYDVRVMATDAVPGTGPSLADGLGLAQEIGRLAEVAAVVPVRFGGAEAELGDDETFTIELIGAAGRAGGEWTVLEGQDLPAEARPGEAPGLLVNRAVGARLGARPGTTVRLRGACGDPTARPPSIDFRLAGIASFPFDATGSETAAVSLDDLVRLCASPDREAADLLLVAARPAAGADAAVHAIRNLRDGLHVVSNRELVERLGISNFSYFRQISFALSVITVFFAFLLVAMLLTVSVNQRLGEIAGLRALGFRRARVVADLICESLLLVGTGGALSLPLGGLLARWLDTILRDMPGLPASLHFFVFQPRALVLHGGLLLATALVAALWPVLLVARLPIAATLRREVVS
jgi:putative ABC transport system permease protein